MRHTKKLEQLQIFLKYQKSNGDLTIEEARELIQIFFSRRGRYLNRKISTYNIAQRFGKITGLFCSVEVVNNAFVAEGFESYQYKRQLPNRHVNVIYGEERYCCKIANKIVNEKISTQ